MPINYVKLVRWNNSKPFAERVSVASIERRRKIAGMRGRVVALHASIRGEVDAKLAAMNPEPVFTE